MFDRTYAIRDNDNAQGYLTLKTVGNEIYFKFDWLLGSTYEDDGETKASEGRDDFQPLREGQGWYIFSENMEQWHHVLYQNKHMYRYTLNEAQELYQQELGIRNLIPIPSSEELIEDADIASELQRLQETHPHTQLTLTHLERNLLDELGITEIHEQIIYTHAIAPFLGPLIDDCTSALEYYHALHYVLVGGEHDNLNEAAYNSAYLLRHLWTSGRNIANALSSNRESLIAIDTGTAHQYFTQYITQIIDHLGGTPPSLPSLPEQEQHLLITHYEEKEEEEVLVYTGLTDEEEQVILKLTNLIQNPESLTYFDNLSELHQWSHLLRDITLGNADRLAGTLLQFICDDNDTIDIVEVCQRLLIEVDNRIATLEPNEAILPPSDETVITQENSALLIENHEAQPLIENFVRTFANLCEEINGAYERNTLQNYVNIHIERLLNIICLDSPEFQALLQHNVISQEPFARNRNEYYFGSIDKKYAPLFEQQMDRFFEGLPSKLTLTDHTHTNPFHYLNTLPTEQRDAFILCLKDHFNTIALRAPMLAVCLINTLPSHIRKKCIKNITSIDFINAQWGRLHETDPPLLLELNHELLRQLPDQAAFTSIKMLKMMPSVYRWQLPHLLGKERLIEINNTWDQYPYWVSILEHLGKYPLKFPKH